jgi:hypothetical protein
LTSSEWLADAAEPLRVKQEDDAMAERALRRKQQRRRQKTEVRSAAGNPHCREEREDDEALEVRRRNAMRRTSG